MQAEVAQFMWAALSPPRPAPDSSGQGAQRRKDSHPAAPVTGFPFPASSSLPRSCIRQPDQVQMPKPKGQVSTLNFHCWMTRRKHVERADFSNKAAERIDGGQAGLGGEFCTGHERSGCSKKISQQYWGKEKNKLVNSSYTWVFFLYLNTPLDVDMTLINLDTKHPGSNMKNCLWGKPMTELTNQATHPSPNSLQLSIIQN